MKRLLRQIYDDLSNGRLSQKEALEKIKAIKLGARERRSGTLYAVPEWRTEAATPADDVLSPRFDPSQSLAERYSAFAVECFERIQTLLQRKTNVRLQVVLPDGPEQALFAGISGLLATASLENPNFSGEIVTKDGARQVLRWKEIEAPESPVAFKDDGVYLITGGAGGVGQLFARQIAATTKARVILAGRSPLQNTEFPYIQADVTDREQVARLIESIDGLRGILHCAGVIADNFIVRKSSAEFRSVLAPKVAGTLHLDEATRELDLDFFVLFSSFAGALGNVGQSDYAAANGFLDQFAAHRNRLAAAGERRGVTRSINWPLWQDGGMGLNAASEERLLDATGIRPMQTATGIDAFHRALALPHDQLLVAEGDPAKMRLSLFSGRPIETETDAPVCEAQTGVSVLQQTEQFLRNQCADLLQLPPEKIDPHAALEHYGIDSILAMKLTTRLEQTFGALSKTLFFEYQTLGELSKYFIESHAARLATLWSAAATPPLPSDTRRPRRREPAAWPRSTTPAAARPPHSEDPIAIIGLSGRYPEAIDLDAYWRNLRDGKDCITEVPKDRWDWREYFTEDRTKAGHHFSKVGGFIAGVDEFDPLFFNISPKEAKTIDPQERLFLQHAWMAVEDAGYTRASLQTPDAHDLPGQVGVYAGVMYSEYQLFGPAQRIGIPGSPASIANRVSYALNLHGPSVTLDTMCSSSLTAIHFACLDLKLGRTSLAIAGGVNVTVHPNKYLVLSGGQFISSDGHCQSFGEGGDGYIPGEGVGVVVLKRLSDAKRDGDHIYGVIRGSALNHGGKTNGYTVPNPQAQAGVIRRALHEAKIDARQISYIEAHGTGTKLGDPIEIAALTKAFNAEDRQFCLIGSAKSNIGHCESAAGIAGLTKVLLQMKHKQIVPSLHSAQLNPHIDFEKTPFIVNQTLRAWDSPRIAGISSFGAGGSNAHLIIEEYVQPEQQPVTQAPYVIVLSARTSDQLRQKASDLLEFVRTNSVDIASLAYTLQAGREAMAERAAFVVDSIDELIAKLQAGSSLDIHGHELAAAWLKGENVDWLQLYGDAKPSRISLPVYPFAKDRYWIDATRGADVSSAPVLHPLLHRNTSDVSHLSYASTFRGDESFIGMPQAAHLEMARAAVQHASRDAQAIELREVVWAQPAVLEQETSIALFPRSADRIDFEIYSGDVVHCQGSAVVAPAEDVTIDLRALDALVRGAVALESLRIDGLQIRGLQKQAETPRKKLVSLAMPGAPVSSTPVQPRAAVTLAPAGVGTETARRLLQQHLARHVEPLDLAAHERALTAQTGVSVLHDVAQTLLSAASPIALQSKVVRAEAYPNGVVVVTMEDRDAKNMFSDALVEGIDEAFAEIDRNPDYKVVVLTGYDQYFASGGTKESLLDIQRGALKFTDVRIYQTPLNCKLPVIAAMQGHGIGAGWAMGLLADVALMSEESRYVSPYMEYGFTPGAGATYILPATLGRDLGHESLLTAKSYTGRELKERGVQLRIVPRPQLLDDALSLAAAIAESPREQLLDLKRKFADAIREPLEETYRLEVAMHEQTFVGQTETLQRIESNFLETAEGSGRPRPLSADETSAPQIMDELRTLLARELQMSEGDIADHAQFIDLGLDSVAGVTWIRKINEKYKTSIEATKIYNYPTLAQLSAYVRDEAAKNAPAVAPAPAPIQPKKISGLTSWRNKQLRKAAEPRPSTAIAVVGMAGQFPQAKNTDEFWHNLAEGRNCIVEVPKERWDAERWFQAGDVAPGKTNSKWFGALEHFDRFDPLFFNISPAEAESMDPQQRLFLQACWQSIEHAGYDARALSGSRCGVFVGCAFGDYHLLSREQQLSGQSFTGDTTSILAGRVSYFLNLQGPSVSIDTACSSSLVALASACDSLASGGSDLALAGGVYVMAGPEIQVRTAQVGMLSPNGRCFTFDHRADGIVLGEGVGVVLLKRLEDAERDGDVIYGVIEGWGVNQDGKTNGITAPNPESQTRLEQFVYDKFQIDPANIQLIETHGTGTKLGDPIEVEGLRNAFRRYTQKTQYCALGSVKSNIGHSMTAAGISGVIKLLLALQHKQMPPTINFERLNEHIALNDSPFYVNDRLQDWQLHGAPRRLAAISSFGYSGTNAHIVIGEHAAPARVIRPAAINPQLVPLSARTPEQLRQKAADLAAFLRANPSLDLQDVAYTLQVGRASMDERLGVVASTLPQLIEKLEAFDVLRGRVTRNNEGLSIISQNDDVRTAIVDNWIAARKYAKLLELWVKGVDLDWQRLYGDAKPRRIALPLYPFANDRYWIEADTRRGADVSSARLIHPLLHTNTSNLDEQRYESTFNGREFFLTDHQVKGQKVLPGVAYLEMARAAIELAMPDTVFELRDIVWVQPVIVDGDTQVHIALSADDRDEIEFEIYSGETVHCQGRAVVRDDVASAHIELEQLQGGVMEPSSIYPSFARTGLQYGPAFQGIQSIQRGGDRAIARLRLPRAAEASGYVLHPSVMDSALQTCIALDSLESSNTPWLPFALDSLQVLVPCSEEMVAHVRRTQAGDAVVKVDIDLCDAAGNVAVQMRGFSLRALSTQKLFAAPVWRASNESAHTEYAETHVLEPNGADYTEFAVACFERIQSILQRKPAGNVLVQVAIDDDRFAGIHGLLKTAELENPQITGEIVLNGVRQVLEWQEVPVTDAAPIAIKRDGVYLITGGRGALGSLFANEIRQRGGKVIVAGREELADVERFIAGLGRIDGILHCAGMIADNFIIKKTVDEFRNVLAPKVTGTIELDRATKDLELDFFVLFSSVAGVLGNVGQADYAAANGFMDRFAAERNRQVAAGLRHGRTRSINWPLWQAGGMKLDPATLAFVQRTLGAKPMQTATGIDAFHRALALPYDQLLVAEGDVAQMRRTLIRVGQAPSPVRTGEAPVPHVAVQAVQEYLRKELSGLLKMPAHQIDPHAALETYGIDSILALKLTNQLEQTFGALSKTLFFEYRTIDELTQYFVQSHAAKLSTLLSSPQPLTRPSATLSPLSRGEGQRRLSRRREKKEDPIAIVGLSGRYPEAIDLDAYWRNLRDGKDCITEVPKDRWDWKTYYSEDRTSSGNHFSKWGGFIAGVDEFDPLFFNISPKEAKLLDPQERLFLQHAWMAIEDAGYTRASLQLPAEGDLPGQVGVYVGVMYTEYQLFGAAQRMGIPGSMASIANRVSYALNLHGPSMTLDTMCSSSLTAIHLACQDLKLGRTSLAIAGGVNVTIHPNKYLVLSAGQFISSDGHCQSFGEGGDGYIPGEGVGVVVLKRLADAKRDGDPIYGVIRGSALNHGGKTNGYSVPNPQAQAGAISRALAESKIDARHISYIEAHGTGTKLGDPIEIAALTKAFNTPDTGFCLIGSAKSNIGHCESAAGIAGLTKVLLQMKHRQIVPSLHSEKLNPHIDFEKTPFVVNQTLRAWDSPRIAGISSFGAGGSNAHLIIEEYVQPEQQPVASAPYAIVLSARTAEQLQQKTRELLEFVRANAVDVASLAYTLQAGREAMDERLGFIADSLDDVIEKLQHVDDAYRGSAKRDKQALSLFTADADLQQTVEKWIEGRKLPKLLELWVKGLEIDWSRLYDAKPRRISLPAYPFARERHWIDTRGADVSSAQSGRDVRSPLVVPGRKIVLSTPGATAATAPTLLEQHLARPVAEIDFAARERALTAQTGVSVPHVVAQTLLSAPSPIALQSSVVTATAHPGGIVVIRMEDRDAKNMFSEALVAGLTEAFAKVEASSECKVVVLTGYDSYFASGGTKESLLAIQAGKAKFTDTNIFRAAFDCKLPVIAALQGHGIGAGWCLGMFADFAILSEESRYVSPYMEYGFTPGAGATFILPATIGRELGHESLITAKSYTGRELKERGVKLRVLPRAEVEAAALELARTAARNTRETLLALKQQWTAPMRATLDETLRLEVAMHEKTFVGQAETLQRIESNFIVEEQKEGSGRPRPLSADETSAPLVMNALRALLAAELLMSENDIDEHTQFIDLGLDSVSGVSWIRKINEKFGTSIEATKVYSFPTLAQLSRHVREEVEKVAPVGDSGGRTADSGRAVAAPVAPIAPAPVPRRIASNAIAVVGMAGQFPQARNLDEFWRNIAEGRDCISEVPRKRWDLDRYYQPGEPVAGKTYSPWLGGLEDYDLFDPLFFNISPIEAENMDPQQRLFLQTCWHGLEDAGYDARRLGGSKCGVFVGVATGDYHQISKQHQLSAHGFTGNATSILAARIAYFLDLQGPCVSIDTACSSSLVAIAQACDSLMSGASDMALAGGVYVMSGPEMHIRTAQAAMLSPEGRCFTFDQRANGFVPGEGVGVVVLKRLEDAQRDGDIVYGVIQGWGVNQDGRTNGITAPNPDSQTRLMHDVYEKFAVDPANIQLVEAHGTGTKLGDPIEVEGLKASFRKYTQKTHYCAIGSVKSNIGHTLTAAGVAGVIKLLLALRHRQLPPTIHFERLNEHIDLAQSPFFVNTQLQPWELQGGTTRQSAISSFGFSGTNAHLVIGEHVSTQAPAPVAAPQIIPLSARTTDQLRRRAYDVMQFVRKHAADLADVAYTLQNGRAMMDERVAFVAGSTAELATTIDAWLEGDAEAGIQGRRQKDAPARPAGELSLKELAELWVKGLDLEWTGPKARRISMPVYPFAKERYWIEAQQAQTTSRLHPLVHENISDLSGQRYRSTFAANETPHAGAILEMVRVAIELALPLRDASTVIELHDTAWPQPMHGEIELTIALNATSGDQIEYEITSNDGVHCRGTALLTERPAATKLDLEQLGEQYGSGQFLARLTAADQAKLMRGVLQTAAALRHTDAAPEALRTLRVLGPCGTEMLAWIDGDDIDLCDPQGNVCVEMRGLSFATGAQPLFFRESWKEQAAAPASTNYVMYDEALLRDGGINPLTIVYTRARGAGLAGIHSIFALFNEIKQSKRPVERVVLVGDYDPSRADTCWDYAWAGFERSLRHVLPKTQISILYTDDCTPAQLGDAAQNGGVIWYRNGQRHVLAIEPAELANTGGATLKQGGTYLITGGTGALGMLFARYLAENYSARLLLLGRRPQSAAIRKQLDLLVRAGAKDAQYHAIDVCDREALASLPGPIDGIIHAAGVESAGAFFDRTRSDIESVLLPKTLGTIALDEAFGSVDFVCYFSSTAAALGDQGAADYAIANRFQTAYAIHRARRAKTVVINWPFWQDGGMGFKDQELASRYLKMAAQEFGNEPLATQAGLELFRDIIHSDQTQAMVMVGDPARVEKFLQRIYTPVVAKRIASSTPAMPQGRLEEELRNAFADLLHMRPSDIALDQPFNELGLDSFLGTEWINGINKKYGVTLPNIVVYDYPNINALAAHIEQLLPRTTEVAVVEEGSGRPVRSERTRRPLPTSLNARTKSAEKIAIIGMSGRYPQAPNVDAYWKNLAAGKNSVVEIPAHRWDIDRYFDRSPEAKDKTYSKWLGMLDDVDCFDPLFFRIAPHDAVHMDPQARLFLEESYRAFEDAGYSGERLNNRKCGVYLGISNSEYSLRLVQNGAASAPVTSISFAVAAARIAYYLNLKGPAIAVDTACSSSLVALHLACQALLNGETDMALAGGSNLWLNPEAYLSMSRAGMLSASGQCRAFDDGADGIVVGEGVGALVLKRLSDAEADGDFIHGVILGSGINQDGRTNGITAPSVQSQTELIRDIYERNGIDPETISYVEAHGTGTKLGDPIELTALSAAFNTSKKHFCGLGSVKSNIGHTAAAAGVASVQKVLLSMRHRTLVPTLHVEKENAQFDFEQSPFYVSRETKSWSAERGVPRRAAVSSFGFSGTNAHVVIEEYVRKQGTGEAPVPTPVPLSARTEEQLRQRAADLLEHLATNDVELADLAYTLQTGRDAMEERLGFIVSSIAELTEKLRAYLDGNVVDLYRGRIEAGEDQLAVIHRDDDMLEAIDRWIARRKYAKLLDLWTKGLSLDWNKLYVDGVRPHRTSLPAYPFAKERYWIEDTNATPAPNANLRRIEDIFEQIDDDSLGTEEAVRMLKVLV